MVKNGLYSPFVIWRQFWASHLPSAFLQRPLFSNCEGLGWRRRSKLCGDCIGLIADSHDSPSLNTPRVAYQISSYRRQKGKRRIKTIFDQFRNTHARNIEMYGFFHQILTKYPNKKLTNRAFALFPKRQLDPCWFWLFFSAFVRRLVLEEMSFFPRNSMDYFLFQSLIGSN